MTNDEITLMQCRCGAVPILEQQNPNAVVGYPITQRISCPECGRVSAWWSISNFEYIANLWNDWAAGKIESGGDCCAQKTNNMICQRCNTIKEEIEYIKVDGVTTRVCEDCKANLYYCEGCELYFTDVESGAKHTMEMENGIGRPWVCHDCWEDVKESRAAYRMGRTIEVQMYGNRPH